MNKALCGLIIFAFLLNSLGPIPIAEAQELRLPVPGAMVQLSSPLNPPVLKGVTIHPDNPFKFDFILDRGNRHPEAKPKDPNGFLDSSPPAQNDIKLESTKLIKYFLASITTPENDLWVNLSPYEKNRIIPKSFGQTDMGRDLLAEDYILKQITASLIYPEGETGRKFWKRIYSVAAKKYGTTNISVNTFNKVWIVPDQSKVYEHGNTAYIVKARLKVMLEEDYLSLEKNTVILSVAKDLNKINSIRDSSASPQNDVSALGSQVVREIVIPELEKEVNEGQNFATLRQVYYSLILAVWFKKRMKDSILGRKYMDQNKVSNLSSPNVFVGDPSSIYQRYLKAFKRGVYNYIKEDPDPVTGEMIPRKYFSGGAEFRNTKKTTAIASSIDSAEVADDVSRANKDFAIITVNLSSIKGVFPAAIRKSVQKKVVLDPVEQAYRMKIVDKVLSVLTHGLVSPRKARALGISLFHGSDNNPNPDVEMKNPIVVLSEIKRESDFTDYEKRFVNNNGYDAYLRKIIDELFRLNQDGNSSINILGERTRPGLAAERAVTSSNVLEERLRSGVLILMSSKKSQEQLAGESSSLDAVPNVYSFPELHSDLIEAIFVPENLYRVLFESLPRALRKKLINVKGVSVPEQSSTVKHLGLRIPNWYQVFYEYLSKHNEQRTLMLHGMRLPTKTEFEQENNAKSTQANPAMNVADIKNVITRVRGIVAGAVNLLGVNSFKIYLPVKTKREHRDINDGREDLNLIEKYEKGLLYLRLSQGEIDPRDYYRELQKTVDPRVQVVQDVGIKYGNRAIKAFEVAGKRLKIDLVPLLVEPGISTRAGKFLGFIEKELKVGKGKDFNADQWRDYYAASLGSETVFRGLRMLKAPSKDQDLLPEMIEDIKKKFSLSDAIELRQGKDVKSLWEALKVEMQQGGKIGKSIISMDSLFSFLDDVETRVFQNFRGMSIVQSVSLKEQVAKDVTMKGSGREGQSYIFKINIPAIYCVKWNEENFPRDQLPGDGKNMLITSDGNHYPVASADVESFVQVPIKSQWIDYIEHYADTDKTYQVEPANTGKELGKSKAMNTIKRMPKRLAAPGGIDLTAKRMHLEIEADKGQVSQSLNLKALEDVEIDGLYIKDIEIRPMKNLPQLLGVQAN